MKKYVFYLSVGYMKKDVVMLNFFPKDVPRPVDSGPPGRGEYIFLVDRSGQCLVRINVIIYH